MKNIFENSKIPIFILNKEGEIQNLNPSAEIQTVKFQKELTVKKFLKLFPELNKRKIQTKFTDIIPQPVSRFGIYVFLSVLEGLNNNLILQ